MAVGKDITYTRIKSFNPYTFKPITVVVASDLARNFFPEKNSYLSLEQYREGDKEIPWKADGMWKGSELAGIRYEQLMPYVQPEDGDAFVVVVGDFVSTEDGTGIVHIAPSFGADDFRTSKQYGLGSLTLVNKQGQFVEGMGEFAGRYVKPEYDPNAKPEDKPVDVDIAIKLKTENKALRVEKYEHSYPHCWRTDKPILYYPLDSWFIRTTAIKDRMIELNNTINWKPASTGTGRFGNWLENLMDWNLSRSRYWGIPLPVWRTEDAAEEICIGSVEELKTEIEKSIAAGLMKSSPYTAFVPGDFSKENYNTIDLHKPFVDDIILLSPSGKPMYREKDLIDVWFDSGSMPYAQFHYPFENKDNLKDYFPADFIAEGVDQTRGWFFTLHAISSMVFDSASYKTVVSNGLVLDKDGMKMSKRLGNAVDPFDTIHKFGADATRWYMITNAQPWDNLKFDLEGVKEVQRKFFGTLYNTYAFFALYANIDGFRYSEPEVPLKERPELDRWILSLLNSLIREVDEGYREYEPTRAGRLIQDFVNEHLSNWYVRLSRRRFWKGEYSTDKISAYQTLYRCLETVAMLAAPISPFYMERLYRDLNNSTGRNKAESVHLADLPPVDETCIDKDLEERMALAQTLSSMVLSLRKKVNIRVRQPLNRIMIPMPDDSVMKKIDNVTTLILSEVNVKKLEYIQDTEGVLVKKIKPDFKVLGPKYGKKMKAIAAAVTAFSQPEITALEKNGNCVVQVEGEPITLSLEDVEILSEDIPGWQVAVQGTLTVALDITITDELREEGIARELINRIQNLRKDKGFDVTDKISVEILKHEQIIDAVNKNLNYICTETLATSLRLVEKMNNPAEAVDVDVDDSISTTISISKN